MELPASLSNAFAWLQATAQGSPELAAFGLLSVAILGSVFVVILLRRLIGWTSTIGSAVSASARSLHSQSGYRILLSPPTGRGGGSAFKFLAAAADKHMSSFSFDAPLQLGRTARIVGGRSAKAERAARRRLKRADADLIVWGERIARGPDGLVIFSLSRAGGLTPDEAVFEQFSLPTSSSVRSEGVGKVAAYLLAKRLQPSLGRPVDFRAERLEPVAEQLEQLLPVAQDLSSAVRNELERDFSAAALHVGESKGEVSWLEKVITLRRATLQNLGEKPQAGIWAEAKLDLGCAMIAAAYKKFDQALVAEGSAHLVAAIEVIKAEPTIRRVEDAIRILESARELTANRDRFSINFNG